MALEGVTLDGGGVARAERIRNAVAMRHWIEIFGVSHPNGESVDAQIFDPFGTAAAIWRFDDVDGRRRGLGTGDERQGRSHERKALPVVHSNSFQGPVDGGGLYPGRGAVRKHKLMTPPPPTTHRQAATDTDDSSFWRTLMQIGRAHV